MSEILEAQTWSSNSELIEAVFKMHVWPKKWGPLGPEIMDVTYGRGLWWPWLMNGGRAHGFTSHDLKHDGVDFRQLPEPDESMDVIAYDPDYVAPGGRKTSTITDFNDRYGLKAEYETPASLQENTINAGLTECARVVAPQGLILAKCSTYISSGKPWLGEYHTIHHGLSLGLRVEDILVHIAGTGPQPERLLSRQQHARSNSSRLIVFRKLGRRKKVS